MKPYLKAQYIPLVGLQDRRRKLTEADKLDILARYKQGHPIREIARNYEDICSRRSIQFVIFPERLAQMQEKHRAEQHWKTYYIRERNTTAIRNTRNYKYKLYTANSSGQGGPKNKPTSPNKSKN